MVTTPRIPPEFVTSIFGSVIEFKEECMRSSKVLNYIIAAAAVSGEASRSFS